MDNSKKIILDLCGGTGSWSRPYKDAGYEPLNDNGLLPTTKYENVNFKKLSSQKQRGKMKEKIQNQKVIRFNSKGQIVPNPNYKTIPQQTGRLDDAMKINIKNLPEILTLREAADILRVSPLTIKRWGKRGKLEAIRINSRGDRRYKKETVLKLIGS